MDGSHAARRNTFNAITALTHKAMYTAGLNAKNKLSEPDKLHNVAMHENVSLWPSIYTGIGVITNRVTPPHRDNGGCVQWYDLLASCSMHSKATLDVAEIQATFAYPPGTVIQICGKILTHQVDSWVGGERICIAHYMRNMVHEHLGIDQPMWSRRQFYLPLMNRDFCIAQGW